MIDLSKPLYSLTVGEYIELNKKILKEEAQKYFPKRECSDAPVTESQDIIFLDELSALTGYRTTTLYSKVCKCEIPVLSRRRPLTFSRSEILEWLKNGKPTVIEMETRAYMDSNS